MFRDNSAGDEEMMAALLRGASAPGLKLGLERIELMMKRLGHPERRLRMVHVAGTNGKGSCCSLISAILMAAGYNVGCYMSPHLDSYRERYLYNGQPIALSQLKSALEALAVTAWKMQEETGELPTEFELLTALAFEYFAGLEPDWLVVETGLGGIYDATNIIRPELSVITAISQDHTALLGSSSGEIAANKAGIIKAGVPVAAGKMPPEALRVIEKRAGQLGASLVSCQGWQISIEKYDQYFRPLINILGPGINAGGTLFGLRGRHQLDNLALSLAAIAEIRRKGWEISNEEILSALASINVPGRLELLDTKPPVFLDVAHNPAAARMINEYLEEILPGRDRILLCGYLDDKDRDRIMKIMAPGSRACVVTRPGGERSRLWQEMVNFYRKYKPDGQVFVVEDPAEASALARRETGQGEYLLATGSFYIAGPVRKYFLNNPG